MWGGQDTWDRQDTAGYCPSLARGRKFVIKRACKTGGTW